MNGQAAIFETSVGVLNQLMPSTLPEVAFCGRSNVGKSSMINRLLGRRSLARTSASPGKTATINFYKAEGWRLIDLPGYGYAKVSKTQRERFGSLIGGYLEDDRDLRLVVQLVDMRHPPTVDDQRMIAFLVDREIPFVVALTKADKLSRAQQTDRLQQLRETFAAYEGLMLIPFSSVSGEGVAPLQAVLQEVVASGEPSA